VATLQQAEDYLVVNPSISQKLLAQIDAVDKLPPEHAVRWHLISMRAAVPTDQMDALLSSLDAVFQYYQHPEFVNNVTSVTSGVGIWLRKHNFGKEAQVSLECAYKYAKNNKQKLTLTNSMALVSRQLNDFENAKELYHKAKRLALADERFNVVAMIENNQGLIALEEGDFELAEKHFRIALDGFQRIDKRSGHISAGINLLMVFLLQNKTQDFQRLYQPINTLTYAFPNQTKQVFLNWLNEAFSVKHEPNYITNKALLIQGYEQLSDAKEQLLLRRYIAPILSLTMPEPQNKPIQQFTRAGYPLIQACQF
jgi:tetratricopeptide (TPR) repeat protein